ncbi:immunity 52 family protein [Myxococcus qinghaiensis]|uniref:immunity 52 family protein n=1 Tax=Myxococcus qinghaiensis TaxID=2906758 RepID=UPI0020A7EA7F|nr:immunity 52 family protein [Myxococcus qinghaiensis]MCP3161869.1 immunity 52 family protein [Myxococcus qinghaiensis]
MSTQPTPPEYPETYYAGAYWGPRQESAEECARRAVAFLEMLAACDPFLSHWNKIPKPRGRGRKTPLMPPELSTLTEAYRRGVNREPGGPPVESLGLTVSAYNDGTGQDRATLSMNCGSYANGMSNACVLSLPSEGENAERVIATSVLSEVVRAMALAWEPDWAVAMSHAYRDLDGRQDRSDMWLGWVTYIARHRGTVPPLPAPVRIEPVEDRGTLIVLTPERFTVANPEHVVLAKRVRELLSRADIMRPAVS